MKKTIVKNGIAWENKHDKWEAIVYDRYRLLTWKFGDVWQCGVNIPLSSIPPSADPGYVDLGVRIGLEPTRTRDESMEKSLNWVENYRKNGAPTWEQLCRKCYDTFPTLFKRESDIIKHVFFTIGNGYSWLDGSIINEHPEDVSRINAEGNDILDQWHENIVSITDNLRAAGEPIPEKIKNIIIEGKNRNLEKLLETQTHRLPLPELKEGINLNYPSEGYSNIMCIPDDITNEYLLLCARIWDMFRYKNMNKDIAEKDKKRLYEEFYERFENRLSNLL